MTSGDVDMPSCVCKHGRNMGKGMFLRVSALILAAVFVFASGLWGKTRVACVGDSITAGNGIKNKDVDSYPAVLGQMLGGDWEVGNFGGSGRTLLRKGDFPYWKDAHNLERAKAFAPDIVIIMLGTNDSKPQNWRHKGDFRRDMLDLVSEFESAGGGPEIFLCTQMFVAKPAWGITDEVVRGEVVPATKAVARERGLKLIDMYGAFEGKGELLSDGVHPNDEGAMLMASLVFKAVTGRDAPRLGRIRGKRGRAGAFERIDIPYRGGTLTCVYPKKALADREWLWILRDFDGLSADDKKALDGGRQLMFWSAPLGAKEADAVNWANEFYFYGREKFGLGPKMSLESDEAGERLVRRFAGDYPDRVGNVAIKKR